MGQRGVSVTLHVARGPNLSKGRKYKAVSDSDGVVTIEATGLVPSTRYRYGLSMHDAAPDLTKLGRFNTHPRVGKRASFTFGYSSCAGNRNLHSWPNSSMDVSNAPVFEQAREILVEDEALFFCFAGDFFYNNLPAGLPQYYQASYDALTLAPNRSAFHRDIPLAYMFDNHDAQPSGYHNNANSYVVPEVDPAYRQRVPSYPVEPGALYQAWQVGRVQFVMTDDRSHRTSSPRTCLGATQKAWLYDILENSDSKFLIWLSASNWSLGVRYNWFQDEMTEIGNKLAAEGWTDRMIYVGGDLHGSTYASGDKNPFGGFPEFIVSGMDSNGGSIGAWAVDETNWNYRDEFHPPNGGYYMWARFHVHDAGSGPIKVSVDMMDEDQVWASCDVIGGETVPTYPEIAKIRSKATALWRGKSYFGGSWMDEMGNGFDLTVQGGTTHNADHMLTVGSTTTTPLLYTGASPLTGGDTPATLIIVTEVMETLNNGYDCLISVGGPLAGDNGFSLFRLTPGLGYFPYAISTDDDFSSKLATHSTALTKDSAIHVLAAGRTADEVWVEMDGARITNAVANNLKTNTGISIGTAYTAIHDIAMKVFGAAIFDGYSLTTDEVADIAAYLQT